MTELRAQFLYGMLAGSLFAVAVGLVGQQLGIDLPLDHKINLLFVNFEFALVGYPAGVLVGVLVSGRLLEEQGSLFGSGMGSLLGVGFAAACAVVFDTSVLSFAFILSPLLATGGYYTYWFLGDDST